jgi:hypothetical protein
MLRAFDFQCENGHKEEYFVKADVKEVEWLLILGQRNTTASCRTTGPRNESKRWL